MKDMLIVSGATFLRAPLVDTSIALKVYDVGNEFTGVKNKLIKLYGEDATVTADGKNAMLKILEKANEIEIEPQPDFNKKRYNAVDAVRVIERLTHEDGCPWDKVQTHESIRINLIEEAYEAVDAIDKHDVENMREEFGDVFLQSLLQSDIARRSGEFDFDDVCDELCKKLIGRHTFIFGNDTATNPDEALSGWEKAKAAEKHYVSVADQIAKMPQNFPPLLMLEKMYKRRKKAGAAFNPLLDLEKGVNNKEYLRVLVAAIYLLADEGKDAEVELNTAVNYIKDRLYVK